MNSTLAPFAALAALVDTLKRGKTGDPHFRVSVGMRGIVFWRGPQKGGVLVGIRSDGSRLSAAECESVLSQGPDGDPVHQVDTLAGILTSRVAKASASIVASLDQRGYLTLADGDAVTGRRRWSVSLYPITDGVRYIREQEWSAAS